MKLNGADYVAVVRLTNKRGDVLAMPGRSCAKVPEVSLPWLLDSGKIRKKEEPKRVQAESAESKPRFGRRTR